MAQSRKHSVIEVFSNTGLGFLGSWIITFMCMTYLLDRTVAATASVVLCTIWSLIRGYFIHRHFAGKES